MNEAEMVVIAGSLPPGTPDESLSRLCEQANSHQVPVILDARGAAMRAAQNQKPLVAKLNRAELAQTLDTTITSDDEAIEAARELNNEGAQHVVVTLGEHGAIGIRSDEVWRVTHPAAAGNPIGAGDAFTAALALALTGNEPFQNALRQGAAAALASLSAPTAGALEQNDFHSALTTIELHRIQR